MASLSSISTTQPQSSKPIYTPLTGLHPIRLIQLAPAPPSQLAIHVRLANFNLSTAPPYDSVSYVWGAPTPRTVITCNGQPFSVTQNLYAALRRARLAHQPRYLWVDAICINQGDLEEQSAQVGFMGKIYHSAEEVLICMGEPADQGGAENVVGLLAETAARGVCVGMSPGKGPNLAPGDALRDAPQWRSVAALMQMPWFRRVWVLQEAGMARRPVVLYGDEQFPYRSLVVMLKWLRGQPWSFKFNMSYWLVHSNWLDWVEGWSANPNLSLFDLLDQAALLECSDLRDHVFAFVGHPLAQKSDGSGPLIIPDYTKPLMEVYQDVMVLLLRIVGARVLVTVEHTEETFREAAPSWVNRWYVHNAINNISQLPRRTYWAGGLEEKSPAVRGDHLIMEGIVMDTVERCFQIDVDSLSHRMAFRDTQSPGRIFSLSEVAAFAFTSPKSISCYGPGQDPRRQCLARALCPRGDTTEGAFLVSGLKHYLALEQRIQSGQTGSLNAAHPEVETALSFWQAASPLCRGRSFVLTTAGRYALAPGVARPGDAVCVLWGLDVPFLMRAVEERREGDEGRWRLVGEAYVEGLMKGEALEGGSRGEVFSIA